jgi:hypothetical protein
MKFLAPVKSRRKAHNSRRELYCERAATVKKNRFSEGDVSAPGEVFVRRLEGRQSAIFRACFDERDDD